MATGVVAQEMNLGCNESGSAPDRGGPHDNLAEKPAEYAKAFHKAQHQGAD